MSRLSLAIAGALTLMLSGCQPKLNKSNQPYSNSDYTEKERCFKQGGYMYGVGVTSSKGDVCYFKNPVVN